MAFRLQSFLAGAAKEATKNLRARDEDLLESIKNSASNLAKEAKNVRKERMNAIREYGSKGRRLRNEYGLNDGQIQTILSDGVEKFDTFVKDVQSGALRHVRSGGTMETFNTRDFIQENLFKSINVDNPGETQYMSLEDQSKLYGSLSVPSTLDADAEAAGISAQSQTLFGGMSEADARKRLGTFTGAEQYSGPGFASSGYAYQAPAVGLDTELAMQAADASIRKTESGIKVDQQAIELSKQKVKSMIADTKIAVDVNKRTAEKEKLFQGPELAALKANTDRINQAISNDQLKGDALEAELATVYATQGATIEKAELQNDLIRAQIIETGTYKDAEELAYSSIAVADKAEADLAEMKASGNFDQTEIAKQQAIATSARNSADENLKLMGDQVSEDLFSKINLDNSFSKKLQAASTAFNVGMEFSSMGDAISGMSEGKMPQFLTALDSVIKDLNTSYGKYTAGKNFVAGKRNTFNKAIDAYSKETTFIDAKKPATRTDVLKKRGAGEVVDFGRFELVRPSKTDDEATKKTFMTKLTALAEMAKPGDITTIPTKDGTNRIYVMGSAGKWLQQ
jgi:hypothetical protein